MPVLKTRNIFVSLLLLVLLLLLFFTDILLGSVHIPFSEAVKIIGGSTSDNETWNIIVTEFRLPRTVTALLAGMALSVSGLQMQTIFRNPLAGPYVLGISSGASLGVALIVMGFFLFSGINPAAYLSSWAIVGASWAGSALVLMLIMAVSFRVRDIMTILILGIMFGSAVSAIVSILQYFSNEAMLKIFVVWTMGSLASVSASQLNVLVPVIITGLLMAFFLSKNLNAMLIGENYARSMGLRINATRLGVFLSTSILAGSITAFCGPIGFIGIAVPHLARIVYQTSDHKILIPGSMLGGGILLLIADIISQLPGYNTTLPINSVTALLGVPIVIWIIVKNKKLASVN